MTEEMIENERQMNIFPINRLPELFQHNYFDQNGTITTLQPVQTVVANNMNTNLNFNSGVTAIHVSNTIIAKVDRQRARECNQRNRQQVQLLGND